MADVPFVQHAHLVTITFAGLLMAGVILKYWLATRHIRHVFANRLVVPPDFVHHVSLQAHQKAAAYTIAQTRFGMLELAASCALALSWTLLGGLQALNQFLLHLMSPGLPQQLVLLMCFAAVSGAIDVPLSWYRSFVLEQKFGFNKQTPALWLRDTLIASVLGTMIALPLFTLILWMMGTAGQFWWLWAWGIWIFFNLLMLMVYPAWIAPLFNKFKLLEDAELAARVHALMQRSGFTSKGLYVMDGSKRSAHSNAYFTGFGAAKRVVFYDTLISALSPQEIDAVLAHELGHFKYRHVSKRLLSMFAISLAAFALLGWLGQQVWFFTGLGVVPNVFGANDALALLLFAIAAPAITGFANPLFSQISRSQEFEADAYAIEHTRSEDLASALLKLYRDNASTLTPDGLYVKFYYGHPPASERLARIRGTSQYV